MKILLTLDFPPEHGGIQRYLYEYVKHTYVKNDKVYVAGVSGNLNSDSNLDCRITVIHKLFRFIPKKCGLIPLFFMALWARIQYGKKIVLECGNIYTAVIPWVLSYMLPVSYSVFTHGTELVTLKNKTLKAKIFILMLERAKTIYANSNYTASIVKNLTTNVHPSIVNPKIEKPLVSIDTRPRNTCCMLSVGRLVNHKGHAILIDAVSQLPSTLQWHLTIIGNGPLHLELIRFCKEKNISDKVTIKTSLSDDELFREYENANLFVLPSLESNGVEGFGMVLLDAMAYKLPIIASNSGGIPEVLDNGNCGVLVEPGNSNALSLAIVQLATSVNMQRSLADTAHKRLMDHYVYQ